MKGTKSIILGALAMAALGSVQSPSHANPARSLNLGQKPYIKGKNGKRILKK